MSQLDKSMKVEDTPGANIPVGGDYGLVDESYFADPSDVIETIQSLEETANVVRFKILDERAQTPSQGTPGSAGFDLYAIEDTVLDPHASVLIDTGIALAIPNGWVGQINPRSSMAYKHNLRVGARIIDSDYRGSVFVNIHNDNNDARLIEKGDRIAQIIFMPVLTSQLIQVDELPDTTRGTGGFGSTGR